MAKNIKKLQIILTMSILIKILGLTYKIAITRIVGLEGMRLISMILPIISLCLSLSSFSIQSVCNQNISLNITNQKYRVSTIMLSCLKITIIASSIIAILMLISFPIYKKIYQESFIYYPLIICIPLIYLSNISGVMKGYLEANNLFNITYLSNLIESLFKLAITIILLIIFKNYSINIKVLFVFLGLSLSEVSSMLFLFFKIKRGRKINLFSATNSYEKKIFKQALPLTLESILHTTSGYITPFIFYYSASYNGVDFFTSTTYYTLVTAYAIPLLINGEFTTLTITKLLFPNVTKHRNSPNDINKIIDSAISLTLIFSVVSFTLCFNKGELLLKLLYNDTTSYNIVKKLAIIYLFLYFNPIFSMILHSFNKEKYLLYISLISHLSSMILIFILTINPKILLDGYIIGLSIGGSIKFILLLIFSFKISHYRPKIYKLITIALLSIFYIIFAGYGNNLMYFILTLIYLILALLFFYYFYNNKKLSPHYNQHT